MTSRQRSSHSSVGIWLRSAFAGAAAAEVPPAMIALLDELETGAAVAIADAASRRTLSDPDFRRELEATIPSLRGYGRSIARDADFADDLLQETLAKAWAGRGRFEAGTNMRAWTFTIYRNLFYSQMRRARFSAPWNDLAAERLLVSGAAQHDVIDLADLYRALDRIPATQRDAILLIGAGGLAYEEAAAILNCAIGTIKSRVSRGRAALAEVIAGSAIPTRAAGANDMSATDLIMAELRVLEAAHAVRAGLRLQRSPSATDPSAF
jgi:RNA polymerase sigma factor (sigma-70 family)